MRKRNKSIYRKDEDFTKNNLWESMPSQAKMIFVIAGIAWILFAIYVGIGLMTSL